MGGEGMNINLCTHWRQEVEKILNLEGEHFLPQSLCAYVLPFHLCFYSLQTNMISQL